MDNLLFPTVVSFIAGAAIAAALLMPPVEKAPVARPDTAGAIAPDAPDTNRCIIIAEGIPRCH